MYFDDEIPLEETKIIQEFCDNYENFKNNYTQFSGQDSHLFRCVILCRYYNWMAKYVKNYLHRNEEINYVDDNGWSLLHYVCYFPLGKNCLDMVKVLLEAGINTTFRAKVTGLTALHLCVLTLNDEYGEQIANVLIDEGSSINIKEKSGMNVLHVISTNIVFNVSYERKLHVVQYLINAGIDINEKDHDGRTALHILSEWTCTSMIENMAKILLVNGADINLKDNYNRKATRLWC